MRDPRRVASGRIAKRAGDLFEAWAEIHYERALALGIVVHPVEHNQPVARVVGGVLVYTKKGIADRTGLLANGLTLAIEEKSTDGDRLARKRVAPKQAAYLDAVGGRGVAILLVEFRGSRRIPARYAVPWREAPWTIRRSAESLSVSDLLAAWEVLPGEECFLARYCTDRAVPKRRVFPRE